MFVGGNETHELHHTLDGYGSCIKKRRRHQLVELDNIASSNPISLPFAPFSITPHTTCSKMRNGRQIAEFFRPFWHALSPM